MKTLLKVIAIVSIILNVLTGLFTSSGLGFFTSVISAIISAAIYMGLYTILDNQDYMREQLSNVQSSLRDLQGNRKQRKECLTCGNLVDSDVVLCPYCGQNNFRKDSEK